MRHKISLLFLLVCLSCSGATISQNPAWWGATHPSLLDGLVAYWKLDETSGTRFDSWGTNHLTDVNSVGSTNGVLGTASGGKNDSTVKYLSSSVTNLAGNPYSASFWLKLHGTQPHYVFSFSRSTASSSAHTLFYSSGIRLLLGGISVGPISVATNIWVHVVVQSDGNSGTTIYTNSALAFTTTRTNSVSDSLVLHHWLNDGANGSRSSIDEFSIFNRLLISSEIVTLFNESKGRRFPFNSGP